MYHNRTRVAEDEFTTDRIEERNATNIDADSDYDSVLIPWGPQWYSWKILNILLAKDKAQYFSQKPKILHRHIMVYGLKGKLFIVIFKYKNLFT